MKQLKITLYSIAGVAMLWFCLMIVPQACTTNESKTLTLLKGEGCADIKLEGYQMFLHGCSGEDRFHTQFTCTRAGNKTEGVVCGGMFKGLTVRYF